MTIVWCWAKFLMNPYNWIISGDRLKNVVSDLMKADRGKKFPVKVWGPLHVLWQVSLGFGVMWPILNWQAYYMSVFFSKLCDE